MAFSLNITPSSRRVIDRVESAYLEAREFRYTDQEKYTRILDRMYSEESSRRLHLINHVGTDTTNIRSVLEFMSMRENIANTMVDWCWTFDPRMVTMGLPATIPWVPWNKQIEFIEWFYNQYLSQKGGLIEKTRDMGATWLVCQIYLQEWRWVAGFAGGFGSNKFESVDKRDDPRSIFEKLRALMRRMPNWWFPPGWNWKKHDKNFNLINPENGANISGEGGTEVGRGGRTSVYTNDEAAFLSFPMAVDGALSQNTLCQFDLSTVNGMNHFGQKRKSGKVDVFVLDWKDDPRKGQHWYENECDRLDPVVVASEIDRNYNASVEGLFIEKKWVDAAMEIKLRPVGISSAGLDVAAGGANKSALALRKGPCAAVKTYGFENGIDLLHSVIDSCNSFGASYLNYDRIGVGYAIYSAIERSEREMGFNRYGVEAGGTPSDIYYDELNAQAPATFLNARAEWWYIIARRLEKTWEHHTGKRVHPEDELICLAKDDDLASQLCSPMKFRTENGKIKVESKDSMKKRGIQSPDKADALIMAFIPRDAGHKHVVSEVALNELVQDFNIEVEGLPRHRCVHYGVMCLKPDMSVECLCAMWDEAEGHLYIYDEYSSAMPTVDMITGTLTNKMRLKTHVVDDFFGNEFMFDERMRTFAREVNDSFLRQVVMQDVKVRRPRRYDVYGSVSVLNDLISKKRLSIHDRCTGIRSCLMSWKIENGKVLEEGFREGTLILMSELARVIPMKEIIKAIPYKRSATGKVEKENALVTVMAEVRDV